MLDSSWTTLDRYRCTNHYLMIIKNLSVNSHRYPQANSLQALILKVLRLQQYKTRSQQQPQHVQKTVTHHRAYGVLEIVLEGAGFELDDYLFTAVIEIDNPRLWWIQQQRDYPQLSIMALDLLTIPAMSSGVEGVFISTGLMITDRRNRLKEDIVKAVECMKSWGYCIL